MALDRGQESFDAGTNSVLDLERKVRTSGMDELLNNEAVESDDLPLLNKARDDAFNRVIPPSNC